MPKDDKDVIRSRLLASALNEPDDRLALQNALVYAKIARFEFPHDWPDAISLIVQHLRNASHIPPLQLARALLVLHQVVKELLTGRLQRSRQNLQAATPEIVHVLGGLWADTLNFWRPKLQDEPDEASNAMKLSLLTMKILRRLLVSGYEHPNRNSEVSALWGLTQQNLGEFMQMRVAPSPASDLLDKMTLQLAKLHHEMSRDYPADFVLLPHTLELVKAYWSLVADFGQAIGNHDAVRKAMELAMIGTDGDADDEKSTTEKLALKGLLIIRACVKMVHNPAQTFKYRTPEDKAEKAEACTIMAQQLLTTEFIQTVMEVIVTKFFVFRASDLQEWEEEPEDWEKREEGAGEDWEFSIRSCAEKLFLDLAINYKEILTQPLLNVFYSVATPENEDVLFKDSVYTAIGLAAPVLHDQLDFGAFVRGVLTIEVGKQKPGFNLIRRRVAIMLGQWISVRIPQDTRPTVYGIFSHLLDQGDKLNDRVVRVTAARQFAKVVDDWETNADQLVPFTDVILTRLVVLAKEADLTDTQIAILNTMSVMVERLEHRITPFAQRIVSLLPPLWEDGAGEYMMKQAIVVILTRLVSAMKADSVPLHSMVFPIIRSAVEPDSEAQIFLLEDALELWAAIVEQTPSDSTLKTPDSLALAKNGNTSFASRSSIKATEMHQLVEWLFPIYELGSETSRMALEITESYILLAPTYMLSQNVLLRMFTALSNLLGSLQPDANGLVCNVIEVAIRTTQRLGGAFAVSELAVDFALPSGLLQKLLSGLRESWVAHCTSGPLAKASTVDGIIETDYFAVLARLILGSLDSLSAIGQAAPSLTKRQEREGRESDALENTMEWLLEEWFSHLENIGDPSRRKLMCLALTRLLATNQTFVLAHLQSLLTLWTEVVTELREGLEDANGDSLVYAQEGVDEQPTEKPDAPGDVRKRQMTYSDDVHTIRLPEYIKQHLSQVIEACGGGERFQQDWLVNVDKEVVAGFSQLGIM